VSVRIGFIGVGGIAQSHLSGLLTLPEAEIVALCDISRQQVEKAVERFNKEAVGKEPAGRKLEAAIYDDYRQMLRREKLEAVFICLPPFVHGEVEEAVIEASLPFLVEKPVALSLSLAGKILDGVLKKELITTVGYQLRCGSFMDKARAALAGKTVAAIVANRFGRTPGVSWYHRQDKSGGQLVEQATHQVDMLRYLVGEVDTVYAAAATRINNKDNPEYDIFDSNCMTMTFACGAVGNFGNGTMAHVGVPPGLNGVHIFGDNVQVTIGGNLRIATPDGVTEEPLDKDMMVRQDSAFLKAVAENDPTLIRSDYLSGVRTLAVTLAGEKSARTGQPVKVADLLAAEAPAAL